MHYGNLSTRNSAIWQYDRGNKELAGSSLKLSELRAQ